MEIALMVLLGVAGTAFAWFAGTSWRSDARRTRRVLRRARVSRIAELVDGQLACVVGTVELEGPALESMVTRRPCVAYDTTVQFFQGTDFTVPARVEVERRIVPFFVVDATGRARVDAAEAALSNRPVARNERFEERVIAPGARIRIVGSVVLEPAIMPGGEHGFREGGWKATITGSARFPLLVDVED